MRWTKRLTNNALAGVAANDDVVIVADRDPADTMDMFRCLDAASGDERWVRRYLARGELDYGNSSRSTPVIHGKLAFLAGALGQLHAVDLASGDVKWKQEFRRDYGVDVELPWGFCSSPLMVDGRLIVNPGGKLASIAALAPESGETVWKTPGNPPGHGSMIVAELGGVRQIVGYDKTSLGGWDAATGRRLWSLEPKLKGDFNVPTPIAWDGKLIVSTENNGTRMYRFAAKGQIVAEPVAQAADLAPDCHSPVVLGDRLFGVSDGLHVLDLKNGLATLWKSDDEAFAEYATLVAGGGRVLAITLRGELVLFDAAADKFAVLSRMKLFDGEAGLYSHPAMVGRRLYVRGSTSVVCLDLDDGPAD
ncbi:MAG: PQQ-binding-like beta-propeller repeat protein [Pirellulales bacterium]